MKKKEKRRQEKKERNKSPYYRRKLRVALFAEEETLAESFSPLLERRNFIKKNVHKMLYSHATHSTLPSIHS